MSRRRKFVFTLAGLVAFGFLLAFVQRMPGLFANTTTLAGILALEIALAGLAHLESLFFPLLMGSFLWAGTFLPFYTTADSLRWLFLGVGALGGLIVWAKNPGSPRLSAFHLVALFCVASAIVSAAVSDLPEMALLKVCSLFLLFLYASVGARAAVAGREKQFIAGLILACEWGIYFTALCYFLLDFSLFGNPNALGAATGVVGVPVMLWAASVAETPALRRRRFFALALCGSLLYVSNSRASILGAAVALLLFTIVARYHRLLVQCVFLCLFFLTIIAVVSPSRANDMVSSFTGRMLYKDPASSHEILDSRLSPWEETLSVIRQHPWFGSGFGTSELGGVRPTSMPSSVHTTPGWNREHGSSYLAIGEYLGLLGVLPFLALLLILLHRVFRAFRRVRATANPSDLCTPLALVIVAGLVHAGFEDWLFAVGSYLCVFFWVCAFLLVDLVPSADAKSVFMARSAPYPPVAEVSHSLR